jgi:surfeit locus 1 family protein
VRARSFGILLLVLAVSAVCVRLGFWQLSRLEEKRRLNADLRRSMSLPPVTVRDWRSVVPDVHGLRVRLRGTFDERHQVLLSGRAHEGSPGVHVVTPLMLEGDSTAVLVDRGWLSSPDAATARPQDSPEPGVREVVGLAQPLPKATATIPARRIEVDSVTLFSTPRLDSAALTHMIPHPLASFWVRELPSDGAVKRPTREAPRPFDETMHLSYAIQWFTFAAILLVGSAVLAASRRRGSGSVEVPPAPPGRE